MDGSEGRMKGQSMNLNEYQNAAMMTAVYPEAHGLTYTVLGLASEAGELAGKLKKQIRDGAFQGPAMEAELGDVLWYVAMVAEELGISLELVAQRNLEKLASRAERGKIGGSGDDR